MRSACVLSALVAIVAAAPAPSPQLIDLAAVDAAPDPVFVSAPLDVASDTPHKKRELNLLKRDGDCAPQPAGSGPVSTPDTAAAFESNPDLQALSNNVPTPDGYSQSFANKDGSLSASKYMGLYTINRYDTFDCASLCDTTDGCQAYNLYIERDPSQDPNAEACNNPPSLTNYKCTLWGAPVVAEQANNKGQWRDGFEVVITGSNGYNKASPPDAVDGFTGPQALGGAINAPLDNGKNTYLGYKYLPFSQSQGYDPASCSAACKAQTGYNSRHPNADGSYATCPLDLTTALRPSLLPDETLLFVQDAVGLYEGKFKIPAFQNGHAYLTSHRACYVDNGDPRESSVAINLKDVERYDFYAGFLKSSPKVTLYPKTSKRPGFPIHGRAATSTSVQHGYPASPTAPSFNTHRASSPLAAPQPQSPTPRTSNATWICPICSYSNAIASNFDPATANAHTPLNPCSACGIKPPLAHVLKAAIANASGRSHTSHSPVRPFFSTLSRDATSGSYSGDRFAAKTLSSAAADSRFQCPRCTFQNHPSLLECELCGAPLISAEDSYSEAASNTPVRPESPGPSIDNHASTLDPTQDGIKFSFRAGGDKIFHERLKGAMTQRKWLLQNAPPIPQNDQSYPSYGSDRQSSHNPPNKVVGIAGLERRGLELHKKNETVIGGAFEDLEALMASAKEVVALAERFAHTSADKGTDGEKLLMESATALGMVTTKDMLGSRSGSESLYLSELSRNVAEYLTDDARGVLKKEGGIVSLVDLWAIFNRTRGGVELVSPADFEKAARLWDKLSLPVRLRQFKNGLLVVQRHDWTDDKTIAQLLAWLQELHIVSPMEDVGWDWRAFGRGVTAQEAAVQFGWSIGVASEELEMAEEKGVLCRDEGVEGVKYWENWLLQEAFADRQQDLTAGMEGLEV
ncbi:MAG: hypothetical protein Q9168_000809 [Polycauliona sp. 1 TL-2023]